MKTAATGCSGSDTSTARYHTGTPQCGFGTSTFTRILTVRSHSGPSQHCTTVSPRLLPSHAVARAWQAFSYFSKCVCSLMPSPEFCAGLSLRYNVQTCPEATAMETPPHQKKKKPLWLHLYCPHNATMLRKWLLQCGPTSYDRKFSEPVSVRHQICNSFNEHWREEREIVELRVWPGGLSAHFHSTQGFLKPRHCLQKYTSDHLIEQRNVRSGQRVM